MANITLLRKTTEFDKKLQSYRMVLEITGTESITKSVFVKQRLNDFISNKFDDVFVAVATPTQLEDFDERSPAPNTSFFRTSQIDIVSRNAGYLETVFDSILNELQKLVDDYEALDTLNGDGIYTITSADITVNTAIVHTHYRLPIAAAPSGQNQVYDDSGTDRQRVINTNTALPGWLNCTDKVGYKFKYNIAADSALNRLWPIPTDKISYAHLEENGLTKTDVLIAADGIFWKSNKENESPFSADYVSPSNVGTPKTLVLDLIV